MTGPVAGCSALIPEAWSEGVPLADPPFGNTTGEWAEFGLAQTAGLIVANERTAASRAIVANCEARDIEAAQATARRWWQVWK